MTNTLVLNRTITRTTETLLRFAQTSLMILGDEALGGLGILKAELFLKSIEPLIQAAARANGEEK